jgi:uncharacterized protein (TIGR02284 family)
MENSTIVDRLNKLIQIDIDSFHAYTQALESIEDENVCETLSNYRRDHERHVEILTKTVHELGGKAPEFTRDFKGFLMSGYTAIRGMMSDEGAIKAMISNENIPLKAYQESVEMPELPEDMKFTLRNHYEDEKKHKDGLEQILNDMADAA